MNLLRKPASAPADSRSRANAGGALVVAPHVEATASRASGAPFATPGFRNFYGSLLIGAGSRAKNGHCPRSRRAARPMVTAHAFGWPSA